MKKTYISPKLLMVEVNCERMIAESLQVNATQNIGGSTNFVKSDRSSRGSYSVWDEDWSN